MNHAHTARADFTLIIVVLCQYLMPPCDLPWLLPGHARPGAALNFQALGINSSKVTSFNEPRRISGPQVPVPDET